ncbi:MAG: CotH kinase family protein [Treponema sp.]|nr:CotH kinase family protein [Treponema sp.]
MRILILQVYGTGNKVDGAVSHSFIELYNNGEADVDLTGYSLQYSEGGTEWVKLDLEGTAKAKCSFLILGSKKNTTSPRLDIPDAHADQIWDNMTMSNKNFKLCLIKSTETLTAVNPFDTDGAGTMAAGYADMFGSIDNDSASLPAEEITVSIDGFEGEAGVYLSKQKSARRKNLEDTDNNKNDFEAVDFRSSPQGISNEELVYYGPKNTARGQWNPVYVPPEEIETPPEGSDNSFLAFNESDAGSGLPVIKIDTDGQSIPVREEYTPGSITSKHIFDWIEGVRFVLYDADGKKLLEGETEMKGRGNSTWNLEKKPYNLKLRSKASVLGMPSHKRWALLANHYDRSLLRTEVAIKLGEIFNNMAWRPHAEAVAFFMNGTYQGAYQIIENIKIDENRVDIDDISADNPGGGYILEIDQRKGEDFNFTTTNGVVFCSSDPDDVLEDVITSENRTVFAKIQADVQAAEDALYGSDFTDSETGYRNYLDVDSFIDWYLVNEITKNPDAIFYSSVYIYYDPVKKLYCMGPIWDFDISLGNASGGPSSSYSSSYSGFYVKNAYNTGGSYDYSSWPWTQLPQKQSNWLYRLFQDPWFVSQVKSRWNAKKADLAGFATYIDQRAAYLENAQKVNFQKWNILNSNFGYGVLASGSATTYAAQVEYVKNFLAQRVSWLDTAINGL